MTSTVQQSDFDFGISNDDLSVNVVYIDDQPVILNQDQYENPFNITLKYYEEFDPKEICKGYSCAYILCMSNSYQGEEEAFEIFNSVMNDTTFDKISRYYTLVKVNRSIVYANKQIKAKVIDRKFLSYFNMFQNYILNENELVILMPEIREDVAKTYANLYDNTTDITQISSLITLVKCYNDSYRTPINKKLYEYISNIKETCYWTNKKNCNFNMSEHFLKREFKYKETCNNNLKAMVLSKLRQTPDATISNVIVKLQNLNQELTNTDYLKNIYRKDAFTDIAESLKNTENRTFYTTNENNINITKDEVNQLFEFVDEEQDLFNLFNAFVISKDLCHFVLNNSTILTKMKPLFDKYLPFYRYVLGVAWITLYTEECLLKTRSTVDNRFVFEINNANKLPIFPMCVDDLHLNPYMSMLVSNKLIDSTNNCLSIPTIKNYANYGICSLDEFKRHFNIFTTGKSDKNILDGINWTNFAVSGSIIPACIPKRHPLMDLVCDNNMNEEQQFATYFNHYYNDSDIDLMCNTSSIFDFMNKTNDVIQKIKENMNQLKQNSADTLIIDSIKTLAIIINYKYIELQKKEICEYINKDWDTNEIIKNIDNDNIKEYFYEQYTQTKFKNNRNHRKQFGNDNHLFNEYYKISSVENMNIYIVDYEINQDEFVDQDASTSIFINDISETKVKSNENYMIMKISEGIKFKLTSPDLIHTMEIFRVKDKDFFSTVGRFHLPCVRSFYDGNNVYMLPSCITAMLTGYNIDYKYFAGVRDPIDIINKYRIRGFNIILNPTEKQHMAYYCGSVDKWNGLFKIDMKKKDSINSLFGIRKLDHEIFKIGKHMKGYPDDAYKNLNHQYIITIDDLTKWYDEKYPSFSSKTTGLSLLTFKTINEDGFVNPIKTWLFEAVQNQLFAK
jgi:hypothetical protein